MSVTEKKAKEPTLTLLPVEVSSSASASSPASSGSAGSRPARLEYHATVHDMPTDQRPRERLRDYGPQALSNAELLAIILRTGTAQDNVLELSGKLLSKYGGLNGLMRAEFGELCLEHGLGEAKTAQLKAAMEIGRRLGMLQPDEKYQIKSPADAANLVMMDMSYLDHEHSAIQVPVPISTLQSCCL